MSEVKTDEADRIDAAARIIDPIPFQVLDDATNGGWRVGDVTQLCIDDLREKVRRIAATLAAQEGDQGEAVALTDAITDALHNLPSDALSWRDGDEDGSDHWVEWELTALADHIAAALAAVPDAGDAVREALNEAVRDLVRAEEDTGHPEADGTIQGAYAQGLRDAQIIVRAVEVRHTEVRDGHAPEAQVETP